MKKHPIDKETARYNAIAEVASLLRETVKKEVVIHDPNFEKNLYHAISGIEEDFVREPTYEMIEYSNTIFTKDEHKDVKRLFLKLCNEL